MAMLGDGSVMHWDKPTQIQINPGTKLAGGFNKAEHWIAGASIAMILNMPVKEECNGPVTVQTWNLIREYVARLEHCCSPTLSIQSKWVWTSKEKKAENSDWKS